MNMCFNAIRDIVSRILEMNSDLTLQQVKYTIEKLEPNFINDKIFQDIYPYIYYIIRHEIKLGLHKSISEINLVINYRGQICIEKYTWLITPMKINMNITEDRLYTIEQEENKKSEHYKKRQNKITQKMINQRMATKQKQQTTKFRKY